MSKRGDIQVNTVAAGVLLAAAAGIGFFLLLASLARPADAKARLVQLESRAEQLQRLQREPGQAAAYPPGAVCDQAPEIAVQQLRQRLELTLGGVGLTGASVSALAGAPGPREALRPVGFKIAAAGKYEAVGQLLQRLSTGAPQVFVDSIELSPRQSAVQLQLQGRIYCWTSAPR